MKAADTLYYCMLTRFTTHIALLTEKLQACIHKAEEDEQRIRDAAAAQLRTKEGCEAVIQRMQAQNVDVR